MPHIPDLAIHDAHDPALVAAHAAGDATGTELELATALVSGCAECAALHRDLRAIAAAVAVLPAPARPRDFRLTPEQAASLHPAGWRGLVATLAGPRFRFAVPLGTGLATLGLAGILLGSVAGLPLGAGGAAMSREADDAATGTFGLEGPLSAPAESGAPAASPVPAGPDEGAGVMIAPSPAPVSGEAVESSGTDLQAEADGRVSNADLDDTSGLPSGAVLVLAGSLAILAGLLLVGMRWAARRAA
jgi:hypothetical protein